MAFYIFEGLTSLVSYKCHIKSSKIDRLAYSFRFVAKEKDFAFA